MHDLSFWAKRAANPALSGAVRVAALAYSRPQPNGHVRFMTGELRTALAVVNRDTGEVLDMPDQRSVRRAVARAVEMGLLAEGSTVQCLRLPDGAAVVGLGNPHAPCAVCR